MHQKPNGIPQKKAKYFGESSPHDLRDLERNAAKAKQCQLAKAASYLEQAFAGMKTAWFGGWALNLRGSLRETHDLSLLILAKDTSEIRAILEQYNWALLSFHLVSGTVQERLFVDIGEEGQIVGANITLSGTLGTPKLDEVESYESITPAFPTPQGSRVKVIHITWQVETKLSAWFSNRKLSDLLDLQFLLDTYKNEISRWSQFLDKDMRETFYAVYVAAVEDEEKCKVAKETLSL
ncbi:hypothetical protein TMEN_5659 [Trichophyton mentagrophytes]|uniref:Uncharacterized protein n=2 Tax=Trichophyton interdigitale TaxID=101480 RepID=A0A9P4YJP7_9EURO|nr:hypothetical protein H101_00502 [Trichophyton interdigitale H6]KAF3895807.1 hypothetical protein GY632_3089 [Trichophyton interdigitale]KDB20650.1 hypothetical protein H109_07403 [Trichophyton interdigitale MR816]GBF63038.1 hypothetical protein TMEN_5659 [Trichophyton mentagrophytes]KAF3899136.1 hypothetical protein GY631_0711 [Trichophyton interdigitale]